MSARPFTSVHRSPRKASRTAPPATQRDGAVVVARNARETGMPRTERRDGERLDARAWSCNTRPGPFPLYDDNNLCKWWGGGRGAGYVRDTYCTESASY
ncbi:hypothetical protein GWI33_009429, partial [Rhynchophorus ferrugineus]